MKAIIENSCLTKAYGEFEEKLALQYMSAGWEREDACIAARQALLTVLSEDLHVMMAQCHDMIVGGEIESFTIGESIN